MRQWIAPGALVAAVALLAGPALAQRSPPAAATPPARPAASIHSGACFARHNVEGFNAPDDHTVYLKVFPGEIYRLDLMGECQGLSWRQSFGLEDRPSSPWICSAIEATVVFRETGMLQHCPVTAIHRLTPEEIKALPRRDRP